MTETLKPEEYEVLAAGYVVLSGKRAHASDCATSCAPAMRPGPCDCNEVDPPAPLADEALAEAVARALAVADGIQICSDAMYRYSSYGIRAKDALSVAIPAIRAQIADAVEREVDEYDTEAGWSISLIAQQIREGKL